MAVPITEVEVELAGSEGENDKERNMIAIGLALIYEYDELFWIGYDGGSPFI